MTSRLQLPPDPRSASQARRFTRDVLSEWQEDEACDLVELLVSELVTNALLHAGSTVDVSLHRRTGRLRIEVEDCSSIAPTHRRSTGTATLGRGLELVDSLAVAWGVVPRDPGKIVWFEVDAAHDEPQGDPATPASPSSVQTDPEGRDIHLRDVPVRLFTAMEEHTGALLREYALVRMAQPAATWQPLATPIDFGIVVERLRDAARSGATKATVTLTLPAVAAEAVGELVELLAEADALAAADQLLIRPALPEVLACRQWFLAEILGQLSGLEPSPWTAAETAGTVAAEATIDYAAVVETLGTAVVVADDNNHIVYANGATEELLGWEPGTLAGQRLTAIIPERLHEAHVAGYTRFLVTRRPRILGQRIEVPARRRDGSEVDVELLLAQGTTRLGRLMFVASLQPLSGVAVQEPVAADDLLAAVAELLVETPAASLRGALLERIAAQVGAQFGAWWTLAEDAHLVCSEIWSDQPEVYEPFIAATTRRRIPNGVGLPGRAWEAGQTVWLTDVVADANFPRAAFALEVGLRSGVALPIRREDRVVGALEFLTTTVTGPQPSLVAALDTIGRLVGMYV